jgi:serine/threonine protein kinase
MLSMDHPHITKFYKCLYDNEYINIVMELIKGVNLADYLFATKVRPGEVVPRIPENICKSIMKQLMSGVKYFHAAKIVHRDLKLDNIMLMGDVATPEKFHVKLIDFGMSKKIQQGKRKIDLNTYCGTIDFIAPEVFEGRNYDHRADLWSCGVIAYCILSGTPPFLGSTFQEIQNNIVTGNFSYSGRVWGETISPAAKAWIDGLLQQEPENRMDVDQALAH